MSSQLDEDTSPASYEKAMKPINQFWAFISVGIAAVCFFSIIAHQDWWKVFIFIPLWCVFACFLGIPAIVNTLRTWDVFKGSAPVIVFVQCLFAALMFWVLKLTGFNDLSFAFVVGGVTAALGMPESQLRTERAEHDAQQ